MGLRQPETKNDLALALMIEARAARMVDILEAENTKGAYPKVILENEQRLLAQACDEWVTRYPDLATPAPATEERPDATTLAPAELRGGRMDPRLLWPLVTVAFVILMVTCLVVASSK